MVSEIPNFVDLVIDSMSSYSLSTFKIGTVVDKELLSNELSFQSIFGEGMGESLKAQLNRETGIGVWKSSGLEAQMDNPHAVAIVDTSYDS